MNKASIGIGIVIVAAAAAFIYFDESLLIRIAAGSIFLLGVVFLYYTLSAPEKQEEAGEAGEAAAPKQPEANQQKRKQQPETRQQETAQPVPRREETAPETPLQPQREQQVPSTPGIKIVREGEEEERDAIPTEYYMEDITTIAVDDPYEEYALLTHKLLQILKDNLAAHTVAIFWLNFDRRQIVLREFVTNSMHIATARRFALGSDLVSQIGISGKPTILTDISSGSEKDLIFYYDSPEGIRSFIGIPVYFQDEPIAVLAADSRAVDSFGIETVAAMGKITSLIAMLLYSYNQKFDLAADAKMLRSIEKMLDQIREHYDIYGVATACALAATSVVDWDFLAVILYNSDKQTWSVVRSMSKSSTIPYVGEGVTVDLGRSVLRSVLETGESSIIDSPIGPAFRFHEKEVISSQGQLCVIPMGTPRQYYGILVVEYREAHQYAQKDLQTLTRIGSLAANATESLQLSEAVRKHLLYDEVTRTSSRTLFFKRLEEEVQRIKAFGGNSVFFLVALDVYEELQQKHGQPGIETILYNIGKILKESLAAYDVVGRFDESKFGVLLMNVTPEDAYLRGEKIRKAITAHVQNIDGQSISISVSLAGCGLTAGSDTEHVLKIGQQALNRALADGGNCVKVV